MKRFIYTLLIIGAFAFLSSCKEGMIYDQYVHTPIAGWEKNDTLSFEVPPLAMDGNYKEELGLRITGDYPFMGLTLIVEQTIYPDKAKKAEKVEKCDTIQCDLIGENGSTKGQGISYYQYNFPINVYPIAQGDSIHITVRHDMKREILPGISDIGLKLTRIKE